MPDFYSLYTHDFARIACCVPRTRVADAAYNVAETIRLDRVEIALIAAQDAIAHPACEFPVTRLR